MHVRGGEEGDVKGEYGRIWGRRRMLTLCMGMVQPSQQHVAPYIKGVEWRLGTRGLRMVAAFLASIPVEVTQEAGVVPRRRAAAIGTPL